MKHEKKGNDGQKKRLTSKDTKLKSNQHIRHHNGVCEAVSNGAKRLRKERSENELGYESRPQAGTHRAKLIIQRAQEDPLPMFHLDFMLEQI